MTDSGTAIKQRRPATQPFDSTSSPKQTAVTGLLVRRYRGGCRPAASWCSGLASRPFSSYSFWRATLFLAITSPVPSDNLVVEGWMHEYAMREAAAEYAIIGTFLRLVVRTIGKGGYINDYYTSASVGAELLQKAGIQREAIQMVPSHVNDRERTYSSAIALRDWFRDNTPVDTINVVTEGAHAR